jgi:hypothetical protein
MSSSNWELPLPLPVTFFPTEMAAEATLTTPQCLQQAPYRESNVSFMSMRNLNLNPLPYWVTWLNYKTI